MFRAHTAAQRESPNTAAALVVVVALCAFIICSTLYQCLSSSCTPVLAVEFRSQSAYAGRFGDRAEMVVLRWYPAGAKIKFPMKISLGADHAGYVLKDHLRDALIKAGHIVTDHGTGGPESVDYPDFAAAVGRDVAGGAADRGILVCGSGVGMSIAANKINGVRAALGVNPDEVALTRHHNDANVLTLGARFLETSQADELVRIFLETAFDGGRHERRVEKISLLERK